MLITKSNPVGLDWYIQEAQKQLHQRLLISWGATVKYDCYGRSYRNKKDEGYVAEVYTSTQEYKEVYYDDKLSAISFFGISDKIKKDVTNQANIHLVFFVNIATLKPTIAHRADEEVRKDVFKALGASSFGMSFLSAELGLENVLKEYPGSRREQRLKAVDMHPIHCFRFNYFLSYNQNKIC